MGRVLLVFVVLLVFTPSGVRAQNDAKTVELKIGGHIALADLVVPQGASLKNGVVVLTHGTMAHKDMELIGALQSALGEQGVASLAHTLTLGQDRRLGMFDCSKPHRHLQDNAAKEIDAWIDWLKQKGAGPITVLGHSRGGKQVAQYAKDNKEKVATVVLLAAATLGSEKRHRASFRRSHNVDVESFVEQAKAFVTAGKPTELMALPGFLHCPATKVEARTVLSYYGEGRAQGTISLIPKLKQRVLVIAGSEDRVVPDLADRVRQIADGKTVRLEVIEDADHFFLDFYAEDAAEKISSFVTSGS